MSRPRVSIRVALASVNPVCSRTAAIVRGSSENTKRFHNPAHGDAAGAAAYIEREFQPEKIAQRYDWLYEYNALTVPI